LTPPYDFDAHARDRQTGVEKSYRKNKQKKVDVEVLEGDGKKAFGLSTRQSLSGIRSTSLSRYEPSIEPCSRTKLLAEAQADVDFWKAPTSESCLRRVGLSAKGL